LPNLVGEQFKRIFASLIGMPMGLYCELEVIAVVTPTPFIENDVGVGSVHNAVGANFIRPSAHIFVLRWVCTTNAQVSSAHRFQLYCCESVLARWAMAKRSAGD
jgi:hypothetical protein